jgi:hypothetical protein
MATDPEHAARMTAAMAELIEAVRHNADAAIGALMALETASPIADQAAARERRAAHIVRWADCLSAAMRESLGVAASAMPADAQAAIIAHAMAHHHLRVVALLDGLSAPGGTA